MIIKTLTINNFRNYVGTSTFDLTTSKDHNIILVGGQNGAGKTSLADSLRLCLYGHWVDGRILSEVKYQEYLNNICSRGEGINSFFVSVSLIMDEENPPIEVDVTRRFTRKGSKFNEELILKKGGSDVELIDETYWSYYIEKLISPTVSRYFFFDGEKVRDVIASSESKDYLFNAVNDVSGITELNHLKADLVEVKRRILSKTTQKASLERVEELQRCISEVNDSIVKLDRDIEDHSLFIEDYSEKLSELEQERSRLIGSSESKRTELAQRLKELNQSYDEVNQGVIDFCYKRLMYKIADQAIRDTVKQAKDENTSLITKYSVEFLENIRNGGNTASILGLDQSKADEVMSKLIAEVSNNGSGGGKNLLDLTLSRIEQIDAERVSDDDALEFLEVFKNREFYHQEIQKFQKKADKIEDDSLEEIDEHIIHFRTQIDVEKIEISKAEVQKQNLNKELEALTSKLRKEERMTVLVDVDRAAVDNIDLVLKTIDGRIEMSLMKSRQSLVKRINEMYHILKNNKDMVKEIRISDSFDLQLISFDDEEINKEFISEGEKGILMYSVVYGLHSLSTMRFPVIIDSPLGRMDSLHVNNLASKLFPTVSDQVILLSHDREVVGENHDLIREYVARQYLITKYGTPKVKEGYFE